MIYTNPTVSRLRGKVAQLVPWLIATRRDLHMHPEPSLCEERTAKIVSDNLTRLGFDQVLTGQGGHGVVGVLRGPSDGPVVAWRADMDAVEMSDTLDKPYRSRVPGVKHSCGHDVHTAIGLGAAAVLSGLRDSLRSTVKMIFQPAEETAEGAALMIGAGALEDPAPEAIFACHVLPLRVGTIGLPLRAFLPGISTFRVAFEHDATCTPALRRACVDAVNALGTIRLPRNTSSLNALIDAASRSDASLLHGIEIGCSVDPGAGHVVGQARTAAGDDIRTGIKAMIHAALDQVLKDSGVSYTLEYRDILPSAQNASGPVAFVKCTVERLFGRSSLVEFRGAIPVGSEDFALFQRRIPGAMFWLGVANPDEGIHGIVHTSDFDVDERCLGLGAELASSILLNYPCHCL